VVAPVLYGLLRISIVSRLCCSAEIANQHANPPVCHAQGSNYYLGIPGISPVLVIGIPGSAVAKGIPAGEFIPGSVINIAPNRVRKSMHIVACSLRCQSPFGPFGLSQYFSGFEENAVFVSCNSKTECEVPPVLV